MNGTNGVTNNGHINHAFVDDKDTIVETVKEQSPPQSRKKKNAPLPPESPELNQALKALDDVLSSDAVSGDSGFNGDVYEENVVALVHRADSVGGKERKVSAEELFLTEKLEAASSGERLSGVDEDRSLLPSVEGTNQTDEISNVMPSDNSKYKAPSPPLPHANEEPSSPLLPPPPPPPLPGTNKEPSSPVAPPPPPLPYTNEDPSTPLPPLPPPPPPPLSDSQPVEHIPPPPPLPLHEEPSPLPLVKLRKSVTTPPPTPLIQEIKEFEKVALRPVKDGSNVASSKKNEEPPPDDHLRFGSMQHENFRRKLEGVFQQTVPPNRPEYKRAATIHGNNFARDEDGQRKPVRKIAEDLSKDGREPERNASFRDVTSKFERTLNINPIKLEHSQRMASTLQSIRVRRARSMLPE